jgi:hypothetical protein
MLKTIVLVEEILLRLSAVQMIEDAGYAVVESDVGARLDHELGKEFELTTTPL